MDPEARRHMWNVIQQVSNNRTVILVSHSMEEIEALCTRVGVMVSGRMQCLGSVQHLKGKFGGGYEVEVRCHVSKVQACLQLCKDNLIPLHTRNPLADSSEVEQFQDQREHTQTLPQPQESAELEELHGGYFRLKITRDIDLARAFAALEQNKSQLEIYDYSISQCTLEQVFIKFAREHEEEPAIDMKHQAGQHYQHQQPQPQPFPSQTQPVQFQLIQEQPLQQDMSANTNIAEVVSSNPDSNNTIPQGEEDEHTQRL